MHMANRQRAASLVTQSVLMLLFLLIAICFRITPIASAGADSFLPVEEAFKLSSQSCGSNCAEVTLTPAPGYYLYRKSFDFKSKTEDVHIDDVTIPDGITKDDPFFGQVEIYTSPVSVRLDISRALPESTMLALDVRFQGCAESGFCYPPETRQLTFTLSTVAKTSTAKLSALGRGQHSVISGASSLSQINQDQSAPFIASASVNNNQLLVHWRIAPHHYLYRDSLKVEIDPSDAISLQPAIMPPPKVENNALKPDGSRGTLEIYDSEMVIAYPFINHTNHDLDAKITLSYQGCSDEGICYPPQVEQVNLKLPATSQTTKVSNNAQHTGAIPKKVTSNGSMQAEPFLHPQEQVTSLLIKLAFDSRAMTLLMFFGMGLLLAFTPCVLPMVPILYGIIAGNGTQLSTKRAFSLSLAYVLSMAITFALLGTLAGLFGANLQILFQQSWILVLMAIVFVALALSMFGVYEIRMPAFITNGAISSRLSHNTGTYPTAITMGLLSSLIVAPCATPPLLAALLYIGQTGDALNGGLALFALGIGEGVPLLLIGTSAGRFLPKSGAWMVKIKALCGFLMLGLAIYLLERFLPVSLTMALWAALFIGAGIYLGATKSLKKTHGRLLWKLVGVFFVAWGIAVATGAGTGANSIFDPLAGINQRLSSTPEISAPQFTLINNSSELTKMLDKGQQENKPTMLVFTADWCVYCKQMERTTFRDPDLISILSHFQLLEADVTKYDTNDKELLTALVGMPVPPPLLLVFDEHGKEQIELRMFGYTSTNKMRAKLESLEDQQ